MEAVLKDILSVRNSINIPILRERFYGRWIPILQKQNPSVQMLFYWLQRVFLQSSSKFTALAHELNLEVLLEIHTEEELEHFNSEIDLVGINNQKFERFQGRFTTFC